MPKRRRLRSGISDAASSLSNVMAMLLQGKMVDSRMAKTQEAIDTRSAANAEAIGKRTLTTQTLTDMDKLSAPANVQAIGPKASAAQHSLLRSRLPEDQQGLGGQPDFESLLPPMSARVAPARKRITEAATPENIPGEQELRGLLESNWASPDRTETGLLPNEGGDPTDIPSRSFQSRTSPTAELENLLAEAQGRKTSLTAERNRLTPRESVTDALSGVTSFLTEEEQGQRGTMKTALTPAEEAAKAGGVSTAQQSAQEGVTNDPINQRARARGAAMEAGSRRSAELSAELSRMGITGQQQTGALQLADDFEKQSLPFVEIRHNYQQVAQLATQGTAAGDVGIIYGYMKILDPGAAVQEGDKANATNAAGIPDRIVQAYNRAIAGDALAPNVRADFVRTARTLYNAAETDHQEIKKTFVDRAAQLRVPASLVVRDLAAPQVTPNATGSPDAGGSALDIVRQRQNRMGGPGPRGN